MPETYVLILRLLLAAFLGGLIGAEREYRAKVAGMRTHLLVAIGAALMLIVSRYGFDGQGDPSRVAAQIVSGIGFIGAGAIMVQRNSVHGLTTAAGIWVAAGIGMTIAAGLYVIGIAATGLSLIGLEVLGLFVRTRHTAAKSDSRENRSPMKRMGLAALAFVTIAETARAEFQIDRSVMSDKYWEIWNPAEQQKIDADIERNRKADGVFAVPAPDGTSVKVEQLDHEFRFGAHIFNFNQLGKTEWNDAYKASYGKTGIFNQATVAFYWNKYEPEPGHLRAQGMYEDSEQYWNSLTIEEAQRDRFWRRPAPGPVIDYLKYKDVRIHGHILIWGSAKPYWIYDWFCPENEKRALDALGIPRHSAFAYRELAGGGERFGFQKHWAAAWNQLYDKMSEDEIAAKIPVFAREMRRIFRKRVADVGRDFGAVVDSWDIVNESCADWKRYQRVRTGLPVWKAERYGIMPGDYPLHALLDAKEFLSPSSDFCINDFTIGAPFREQITQLEAEGARIDVVGCQMHIFNTNDCMRLAAGADLVNWVGKPQTIQEMLDEMAKTGKKVHVSEITISAPGSDDRSRMIQAVLVRNIYRKWFSHPAVKAITWWNTVDGGGVVGEPLVSGLFTRDMKKKPAYEALEQLIRHEWMTRTEVTAANGEVRFRGFRGKYRLTWKTADGQVQTQDVLLK